MTSRILRRFIQLALVVLLSAIFFFSGKIVAEREAFWIAAGNFVLLVDILERSDRSSAQGDYINTMIHGNIVWLRRYGSWITQSESAALKDNAERLLQAWRASAPFRGPEWESRKRDVDWIRMKEENERYLEDLVRE